MKIISNKNFLREEDGISSSTPKESVKDNMPGGEPAEFQKLKDSIRRYQNRYKYLVAYSEGSTIPRYKEDIEFQFSRFWEKIDPELYLNPSDFGFLSESSKFRDYAESQITSFNGAILNDFQEYFFVRLIDGFSRKNKKTLGTDFQDYQKFGYSLNNERKLKAVLEGLNNLMRDFTEPDAGTRKVVLNELRSEFLNYCRKQAEIARKKDAEEKAKVDAPKEEPKPQAEEPKKAEEPKNDNTESNSETAEPEQGERPELKGRKNASYYDGSTSEKSKAYLMTPEERNSEYSRFAKYYIKNKKNKSDCSELGDSYVDENGFRFVKAISNNHSNAEFYELIYLGDNIDKGRFAYYKHNVLDLDDTPSSKLDSKYEGLPDDISIDTLNQLQTDLVADLKDYLLNIDSREHNSLDKSSEDESAGQYLKKRMLNGILGSVYKDENGRPYPPLSGLELADMWYKKAWEHEYEKNSKHANRGMIEAYYIVKVYPNDAGSSKKLIDDINASLKNAKCELYSKIRYGVYGDILKSHFNKIWKEISAQLSKEYAKKSKDLHPDSEVKDKTPASSKIKDASKLVTGQVISSKVRIRSNDTWFNWRVVSPLNANAITLELLDVYCNGYYANNINKESIGQIFKVPTSDIESGDWYSERYKIGAIIESLTESVDRKYLTYDDICHKISNEGSSVHNLDILNKITARLHVADLVDYLRVFVTNDETLTPYHYDDFRKIDFNDFVEFAITADDGKFKVIVQKVGRDFYIYFANQVQADRYFDLLNKN